MKEILDGVLLVDKPKGVTSHDVVQSVRRLLGQREVGHCGTLDPLASGLLVLLLGQGTKLSDYLLNQDKAYRVKLRFGLRSDTEDITGRIVERQEINLPESVIRSAIFALQGEVDLPVPQYSAVKIEGKKLYEYARKGEIIESPVRRMKFWDLKILAWGSDWAEVDLHCSKGSYIRSWAAKIGQDIGCGAVVEELRRYRSAPFEVTEAVSLDDLAKRLEQISATGGLRHSGLYPSFRGLSESLPHWKGLSLDARNERLLLNGQVPQDFFNRLIVDQKSVNHSRQSLPVKALSAQSGRLLALLELVPFEGLKIRRVFPALSPCASQA